MRTYGVYFKNLNGDTAFSEVKAHGIDEAKRIVIMKNGDVEIIFCAEAPQEMCTSLSCQGPWYRDHDNTECF